MACVVIFTESVVPKSHPGVPPRAVFLLSLTGLLGITMPMRSRGERRESLWLAAT